MKWRRLTRRKGLALAGATLGILVLWGLFRSPLGNVPDPPVKVTINGTDEPQTLTDWPRCTVRNLTGRRMSVTLWMSCDPETILLGDVMAWPSQPPPPPHHDLPPRLALTLDGRAPPLEARTLTETATLPPHGERGFQAPLPPTGSARPLRIGILYALEAPWFRQRMRQFEWDLHRWLGLAGPRTAQPVWDSGFVWQDYVLNVRSERRGRGYSDLTTMSYDVPDDSARRVSPFSGSRP